jgi:ribose transport system permease protein
MTNTSAGDAPRVMPPKTVPTARRARPDWLGLGERFGLLGLFALLVLVFSMTDSGTFATAANWRIIAASQAVAAVIAFALMIPLITGNFDLSVGAVAIGCSVLGAKLMATDGWSLLPVVGVTIAVGLGIGLLNGLLVTRGGVNSLIATLGTATIIGGIVQWYSKNLSISEGISPTLTDFGSLNVLGVPRLAVLAVIIALVVAYVQTQTPFGRRLTAIGSSAPSARLVGVQVEKLTLLTFVIAGGLGALAGLMLLAEQASSNPGQNGIGILLPALAAVYLGASTFFPGQFNVPGTVLGLMLVAVMVSGLVLSGAQPWVEPVAQGAALIAAVSASAAFRRRRLQAPA